MKRKLLSLLLVCPWAENRLYEKLYNLSSQRSIATEVRAIEKQCPEKIKIPKEKMIELVQRGYRADATNILERAQSAAYFRSVDSDYARYQDKMKLARQALPQEAAQFKTLISKGKNANNRKATCTNVDLTKSFGPVRDQDSMGWCGAFVDADLASFKLKQTVSAAHLATLANYNKSKNSEQNYSWDSSESGRIGFESQVPMQAGLANGFCLETDFASEYSNEDNDLRDFILKIEELSEKSRLEYFFSLVSPQNPAPSEKACSYVISFGLSAKNYDTVQEVAKASRPSHAYYDLAQKSCEGKTVKGDFKLTPLVREDSVDRKMRLIDFVDAKLSQGSGLPSAISWHTQNVSNASQGKKNVVHVSLVVGRRWNEKSGQCEYQIRNSWGTTCPYISEFSCNPRGHVWLPQEVLHQSIRQAYSFEK